MKKKLFAILLTAVMVASLFPTMAFASGEPLTDLSITIKTPTEGKSFDVSPIAVYSPQDSMEIEEVVWYKISANDYKAEAGAENDWKTVSEGEAAQMEYLYMPLIKIKMAQDYCVGQDAELEFNGTKFRGRDFELGQGPRYDIIGSVQDVYVYGPAYKPNHNLVYHEAKAATAAEFGNTEYWYCDVCDRYFSDENAANEIALADTVIAKTAPKIIAGDGATVTKGEKKALYFTSDAAFEDFLRVEVDGKTVNESSYTVKSGSTVVTLNTDYVATLAVGEHTLSIISQNGTATARFAVNKKTEETTAEAATKPNNKTETTNSDKSSNKKSPQTGNTGNLALWFALFLASGGAVTATAFAGKKKKHNK